MRDVLVLIYSTLFGRQPGTDSNSQYGNESVNLRASEPCLPASRYLNMDPE